MFTLVSMYVGAMTVDKVIAGFNTKKTILIISECSEEIAAAIMKEGGGALHSSRARAPSPARTKRWCSWSFP
jgi:uncharacterized membrane-anchored protein YitT (DUF2179 family)